MSNPALLTGNSAGIFNRGNFKAGGGGGVKLCQREGTAVCVKVKARSPQDPPGYALGSQPMSLRLVH